MAKTKTKTKTKTTGNTLLDQAQAEKDVQYGPQFDAAQTLLGEAGKQYKSDIETAKNNAAAVTSLAEAEKEPTIERFKTAQDRQTGYGDITSKALAGVGGGVGDIFRSAIGGEQEGTRSRLEGAGARATQELSDRQASALSGKIAAQNQARKDYRDTKASLTSQIQTLLGRKQADVMARFGQLVESEADRNNAIDIAKIGAQAKRDVADTNARGRNQAARGKEQDKERKRIEGIRSATGQLKQDVADTIHQWDSRVSQTGVKKNEDPNTAKEKPWINAKGEPTANKDEAQVVKKSPEAIKRELTTGPNAIDPGVLHVALLVRAGKSLDREAIDYIQANPNWRIPREWLPKPLTPKNLPPRYGAAGRGADTT